MTPASSSPVPPDDLLAHAGFVRGLARALVSGDADVDDVVQETWVAALNSRQSAIRSPRSWLASIVRRRAARHHRTRARLDKRHAEGATSLEVPTPDDLAARHETIQKVSAALASLPADYRDVLVLRYYEELPPREVAKRLEIPVETARTRIRRGLARLRQILDEKHDGRRAAWAMPLAGLVPSGAATAGVGAMVVGGIAVAAVLVLGFALARWPWGKKDPPPVEQAQHVPDEPAPPVLMGRGESGPDPLDVSVSASSAEAGVEEPAKIDEEPPQDDDAADKVEVVVRVVDEKGQPVEGLGIREHLRGDGGPLDVVARPVGRTDASGRAVVLASPDAMGFGIEKNDAWQLERGHGVMPEPGEEIVLGVVPTLVFHGRVIDDTGAPVEGVRVLVRYRSRTEPGVTGSTFTRLDPTDADGRFAASLPAYASEVTLSARAQSASAETSIDPHHKGDVILRMASPIWIRGEVVTEDGSPIDRSIHGTPQVEVRSLGVHDRLTVTSPEDRAKEFAIRVPETGHYRVSLSWDRKGSAPLGIPNPMIVEAPIDGIRLICPTGSRLTGNLQGDDVGGFWVVWVRRTGDDPRLRVRRVARTDGAGHFAFDGLVEGDTSLLAYRAGDERFGLLEHVRLPAKDVSIELRRGRSIRGRIRDYPGRHGFGLWLYFTWRGPSIPIEVEDDGAFTVTGLPPGSYGVRWQRAGKAGDLDLEIEAGNEAVEVLLPKEVLRMGQTPER